MIVLMAISHLALIQAADDPITLRLATASKGGSYFQIGAQLAGFWDNDGSGLDVEVLATSGSDENLNRLARGRADLALVTQDALVAYMDKHPGSSAGEDKENEARFCILGSLYVGAAHFVIARDRVGAGTLADLEGALLYPGAQGSGTEQGTLAILRAIGIEPHLVPAAERTLGYDQAAEALRRGQFEAVTLSGGPPVGAVQRLLAPDPEAFVVLAFTPAMIASALQHVPGLSESSIPARTYPGQNQEIPSVGKRTLLVARSSLGRDLAQRLARSIEAGLAAPGAGLRGPESHLRLRALTAEFWRQPLDLPRCAEGSNHP